MRKVISIIALAAATAWAQGAIAQTIAIDSVPPISLSTSSVQTAVSVDTGTGNVSVRTAAGNYTSCTAGGGVNTPVINSFTSSASSVTSGNSFTLSWASSNTLSCSPQQGGGTTWSTLGTLPTSGSQSLVAPTMNGSLTFQLTCTNGSTSDVKTVSVTVGTGGGGGGGGSCTQTYPNTNTVEYSGLFGSWPAFGSSRRLTVPVNGALAMRFTASASTTQFGTTATATYPGDGDGHGQMSISRSPGCFSAAQLGANCLTQVSREPSVGWANFANQFSCQLTPGESYFVNLTYGNSTTPSAGAPYCPSGTCGADVQNQVQRVVE